MEELLNRDMEREVNQSTLKKDNMDALLLKGMDILDD